MYFTVYRDRKKEFRWRLKAKNGRTLADGGEGYRTRYGVLQAIVRIKQAVAAPVFENNILVMA